MPNIPTEEVFTTPDFRGTEGTVTATRRARIHGAVVEAAHLEFRGGQVVSSSAARGADALARFLETDAGARRFRIGGRSEYYPRRFRSELEQVRALLQAELAKERAA